MRTLRTSPKRLPLATFLCAASLLATSCSAEPLSQRQIDALDDFGPGLQKMGEGLHDLGEGLNDAMCRLGKGFARGEHKKEYARHCPARHKGRTKRR
ncbi:MAG: hypothetical protein M3271_11760 [Actinomycetota bacterium]|nr:hypothetical protein [Actinomycetota bacterium]